MKPKKKILVVEDNADLRRLYAIGLNQRGFEVKLAANGAEAVDRIEHELVDVVVLDLLMPVMSGWEVMDRLEAQQTFIPVIVITGERLPEGEPSRASIRAWLSKPVSLDELASKISELG